MPFDDVTDPSAVRQALDEFKALGQAQFLKKYGFGASRGWMIQDDDGRQYDAKAVLGAAHRYQHPDLGPIPQSDFHGGAPTARKLRALGFTVTEPTAAARNPVWSRDELILALDLYVRHRPKFPDDKHPDVLALSRLLNRLAAITDAGGNRDFRNANGVSMKLQNFRRLDPTQEGKGLPGGGKGEKDVWAVFADDPKRLQATAAAIRGSVSALEDGSTQDQDDGEEAEEGRVLTRLHRTRERDRKIVERRKAKALREHGTLHCEACGFDFAVRYGERGSGFIECHHIKPVSGLLPGEKTKLEELVLLCANCHRMVHARRPWISLDELKLALEARVPLHQTSGG